MRRWTPGTLSALALLQLTPGCAAEAPDAIEGGFSVVVAAQVASGCSSSKPSDPKHFFPDGVDNFVLAVTGYTGSQKPYYARVTEGQLQDRKILVLGVPKGDGLTVDLIGCTKDKAPAWTARATNVGIATDDKTAPPLYLTKIDALSCTQAATDGDRQAGWSDDLGSARAFHAAVPTRDGALAIGGFDRFAPSQGTAPATMTAGDGGATLVGYRERNARFVPWTAKLSAPRAMFHAIPYDGGAKVLVAGGVTQIAMNPIGPSIDKDRKFIASTGVSGAEVVDLDARTTSKSLLDFGGRPFSAGAWSSDGLDIVVTGGVESDGKPSTVVQRLTAANAAEVTDAKAKVTSGALTRGRYGHAMVRFGSGHVAVLGGTDNDGDTTGKGFAEVIKAGEAAGTAAVVTQFESKQASLVYHRAVLLKEQPADGRALILVIGGTKMGRNAATQELQLSPLDKVEAQLLLVELTVTATEVTLRARDLTSGADAELRKRLKRLHAAVSVAADGSELVFSGGWGPVGAEPLPGCDPTTKDVGCHLQDLVRVTLAGSTYDDLTATLAVSEAKTPKGLFGHATTRLATGAVLFTGGAFTTLASGTQNAVADAELYAPPATALTDACKAP